MFLFVIVFIDFISRAFLGKGIIEDGAALMIATLMELYIEYHLYWYIKKRKETK